MEAIFHQSDERLEFYALGRLRESDIEEIEEHLLVCEGCRNRLEEAADFAQAIVKELGKPSIARSVFAAWLTLPRLAAAGAFAALALSIGVYSFENSSTLPSLAALQLTAMRGAMPAVHAAREVDLTLTDAPPAGPFKVEVVDAVGGKIWSGVPETAPRGLTAKVSGLSLPGDYFVRLYGASGALLHEYGFHLEK